MIIRVWLKVGFLVFGREYVVFIFVSRIFFCFFWVLEVVLVSLDWFGLFFYVREVSVLIGFF